MCSLLVIIGVFMFLHWPFMAHPISEPRTTQCIASQKHQRRVHYGRNRDQSINISTKGLISHNSGFYKVEYTISYVGGETNLELCSSNNNQKYVNLCITYSIQTFLEHKYFHNDTHNVLYKYMHICNEKPSDTTLCNAKTNIYMTSLRCIITDAM